MKKIKLTKLNNKGFSLVELLAVVVILAVVMGIAMTSVLSSMNNSRKGSLTDSAISVKNAFTTKYSESMVTGTNIYSEYKGGYSFTTASTSAPTFYYLDDSLKDELNISPNTYVLNTTAEGSNVSSVAIDEKKLTATNSFVAFNGNSMVVCMIAKNTGSYYVANATKDTETETTVHNVTVKFAAGTMWSCSTDGEYSWK